VPWKRKLLITLLVLFCLSAVPALLFKTNCSGGGRERQPPALLSGSQKDIPGYARPEESTYLTFPEWFIVYSSEEYANFLERGRPSAFPYAASIAQFWSTYCDVHALTSGAYGFNWNNHVMIWVIGVSYSLELAIKGIYENTKGRLAELFGTDTDEDRFAYQVNREYVSFIYDYPWYLFPYADKLQELREIPLFGKNQLRKWERRSILHLELWLKMVYGAVIKWSTRTAYGAAPTEIYATVTNPQGSVFEDARVKRIREFDGQVIIQIPRYRQFTEIVPALARTGVQFTDIAGNDEIFLTVLAPRGWTYGFQEGKVLFSMDILTAPDFKRVALLVPVKSLHVILPRLEDERVKIEHLYDY
jgi:hypothetical protein